MQVLYAGFILFIQVSYITLYLFVLFSELQELVYTQTILYICCR